MMHASGGRSHAFIDRQSHVIESSTGPPERWVRGSAAQGKDVDPILLLHAECNVILMTQPVVFCCMHEIQQRIEQCSGSRTTPSPWSHWRGIQTQRGLNAGSRRRVTLSLAGIVRGTKRRGGADLRRTDAGQVSECIRPSGIRTDPQSLSEILRACRRARIFAGPKLRRDLQIHSMMYANRDIHKMLLGVGT